MNTTIKPLDDINVRKAILAAFDRDAARKARGGKFVGEHRARTSSRRASPASRRPVA